MTYRRHIDEYFDAVLNYAFIAYFPVSIFQFFTKGTNWGRAIAGICAYWIVDNRDRRRDNDRTGSEIAENIFKNFTYLNVIKWTMDNVVHLLGPNRAAFATLSLVLCSSKVDSHAVKAWTPMLDVVVLAATGLCPAVFLSALFFSTEELGTMTTLHRALMTTVGMTENAAKLIGELMETPVPTGEVLAIERFLNSAVKIPGQQRAARRFALCAVMSDQDLRRNLVENQSSLVDTNHLTFHELDVFHKKALRLYPRLTPAFPWFRLVSHEGRPPTGRDEMILNSRENNFEITAAVYCDIRDLALFANIVLVLAAGRKTKRIPRELLRVLQEFLFWPSTSLVDMANMADAADMVD